MRCCFAHPVNERGGSPGVIREVCRWHGRETVARQRSVPQERQRHLTKRCTATEYVCGWVARPEWAWRGESEDFLQGTWSIARSGEVYFQKRRRNDEASWPVRKTGNDPVRGGMLVCLRCCARWTARCPMHPDASFR